MWRKRWTGEFGIDSFFLLVSTALNIRFVYENHLIFVEIVKAHFFQKRLSTVSIPGTSCTKNEPAWIGASASSKDDNLTILVLWKEKCFRYRNWNLEQKQAPYIPTPLHSLWFGKKSEAIKGKSLRVENVASYGKRKYPEWKHCQYSFKSGDSG